MNFKLVRFVYLAISLIIASFFLIVGIFSMFLPWSSFLREGIIQFILEHTLIFFFFGLGFALIGLSLMIYTLIHTRHRYTHIQTGARAITLDENIIHQYLEDYWKTHFPQSHVPFTLSIKKRSLEIAADLPSLPLADQKNFLEHVKDDFTDLFANTLGYPYEVHLLASFQTDPHTKDTLKQAQE